MAPPAGLAEPEVVAVVAVTATPHETPRSGPHLSLPGLGSLFMAARHPGQAWRMVLPVQLDDGSSLSADVRTACLNAFTATAAVKPACP
jgi:hypothetical protein